MPEEIRKYGDQLEGRSMLVTRAKVIPIEFIVRGYFTGERDVTIHYFLISQVLVIARFSMGRIQETWYHARVTSSQEHVKVSEAA